MASFVPVTASGWKVESAILGPPIPSWRLRPGTLVSGPLVSRYKPNQSLHNHCPQEGHNDPFRQQRSGARLHSFSLGPERLNRWPGKIESFTANLSKGFATVVKAADRRRLVLWSHADSGEPTHEEIDEILAICKNQGWKPQVCCVSMKDYEPEDKRYQLPLHFVSHRFKFEKIQQKLLDGVPKTPYSRTKTIIVIGTCTKEDFEGAVEDLTGEKPKNLGDRPSAYVAKLQPKSGQSNRSWDEDGNLRSDAWELVPP